MATFNAGIIFTLWDKFSSPLAKIQSGINSLMNTANKAGKSFSAFWDEFNNESASSQTAANLALAGQSFRAVADDLAGAVAAPREIASAFESGMARVSTVLTESNAIGGDTAASFNAIQDAARDCASGLSAAGKLASVGIDVYTNSVYTMLSSGLDVKQAMAATEQAALLAKASGGTMAEASTILVGMFNNMGDKANEPVKEMERLADVIAGTSDYFAFENMAQFTEGFKNVGGMAKGMGIPLEQVSAALGQLNNNLIRGAEAGTSIKSVLAALPNASKRLGFSIANAADGGLDLVQTLENVRQTGARGSELLAAFGSFAGPAIASLTENLDSLKDGLTAIEAASGSTLKNARIMAETFATKTENLSNAWAVFQQRIGVGSIAVSSFGVSVGLVTTQTLTWLTSIPLVGDAVAGLAGASLQAGSSFLSFAASSFQTMAGINAMIALGGKMGPMLGMMSTGFTFLRASALTAVPAMWSFAVAQWAVLWPMLAIGGALFVLYRVLKVTGAWETVTYFLQNVVVGAFTMVKNSIMWVWQSFASFSDNPFFAVVGVLFAPFIAVPALIIQHWQPIKDFFGGLFEFLGKGWEKASSSVKWFFGIGGKKDKEAGDSPLRLAGARANGGPVGSGLSYLVGEKEPEIFTPSRSGVITPASKLSGGGVTIQNLHINVSHLDDVQHFMSIVRQLEMRVQHADA